ncbi:MAG TPA: Fe-S cluster assembly protein SufD [Chthoniobacterales bacterium]|nr:Fe-S cluster assembly protein SufD [Chthoniobacterales bacterium]
MLSTSADVSTVVSAPREWTTAPEWFAKLQTDAWREFESEPYPVRTDELWRFSSIKNLGLDSYLPASEQGEWDPQFLSGRAFGKPAGRLIFVNERMVSCEVFDRPLVDRGVLFLSLERALEEHPELLREHFMAQPARLGSRKFAALHKASVRSGSVVFIPRHVEVVQPFEVFHFVSSDRAAVFPHTLVIAEEGSKVTVLENFVSIDESRTGFACGVNDLVAGPGSHLTYISTQDWSRDFVSIQINSTVADRDASVLNLSLNFGGKYSRLESVSRMIGSGARSDMLSISVASGEQEFDQRTLQDHLQPNTTSDLLYKNALSDRARTIFSGLIKVEPGAQRTDAYQKVRNLLLSDEAEANSMPGLEILADDVRCTHGATSGQIEPEELFYLLSRGIPDRVAKALVVKGFLNEVVDRLPGVMVTDHLHEQIAAHLGTLATS